MKKHHIHGLETTATLVAGLLMMVLVFSTAWLVSENISSTPDKDEVLGSLPTVERGKQKLAFFESLHTNQGRVAGITDDASLDESDVRNAAANWVAEVRNFQKLNTSYRDSVLDRNAQNHARLMAQTCNTSQYSDWTDSLNVRIDEGFVQTFSEAIFTVSGPLAMQEELPMAEVDYSRMFTFYDAFGVGVAKTPTSANCGYNYVLVFHLAETY